MGRSVSKESFQDFAQPTKTIVLQGDEFIVKVTEGSTFKESDSSSDEINANVPRFAKSSPLLK